MSTIIARTWKQPKCLWTDKWVKKMGYIHTIEHYTAIKSEEIGSFVEIWMDGESVIQSKSEREKQILYINAHMGISFWLRKGDFQWVCVDRQDRRTNTGIQELFLWKSLCWHAPRSLMLSSADLKMSFIASFTWGLEGTWFFYLMHSLCCVFLRIS